MVSAPVRLSSFDASFLAAERGNAHLAIGAVLIVSGAAPDAARFRAHVESRLDRVPRLRQRLVQVPFRLGTPLWVDDPGFDLDRHLRRMIAPGPGDDRELGDLAGEIFAAPLDRSRPLWELWLIEGLADDCFALVYKTHHALADGISVVDIATLLFDVEPEPGPAPPPALWDPKPLPSRWALLRASVAGLARALGRLPVSIGKAVASPRRAGARLAEGAAGLWEVSSALSRPAREVPLNGPLSDRRSVRWASCDLDRLKAARRAFGVTINDLCLAACAGALRSWMSDGGLDPDAGCLQALVPVSLRTDTERGALGNRLTALRGPLPVHLDDPLARLLFVVRAMEDLKASRQQLGAETIWAINDWFRDFAPPLLLTPTARLDFSTRLFNLLVSNFPGPQIPFYVLGAELVEAVPVGFLAHRHRLAVAILSYNGKISFGLIADAEAVPDAHWIAGYIDRAVAELAELAEARELAGREAPHDFPRSPEA